jgi:hypothetical protein
MSGKPAGTEPQGALRECLYSFPEFLSDFEVLEREGFLKLTSLETCKWLKSKTSLAEYFKWACGDNEGVPGGFWAPIENAFGIKRHSLRRLAGRNANELKPEESRDFKTIKAILLPLRLQELIRENELRMFRYIKHLVILEAKEEEPETIHKTLEKISAIFEKNVDKKGKTAGRN